MVTAAYLYLLNHNMKFKSLLLSLLMALQHTPCLANVIGVCMLWKTWECNPANLLPWRAQAPEYESKESAYESRMACDLLRLNGILRVAVCLIKGVEFKVTGECILVAGECNSNQAHWWVLWVHTQMRNRSCPGPCARLIMCCTGSSKT